MGILLAMRLLELSSPSLNLICSFIDIAINLMIMTDFYNI